MDKYAGKKPENEAMQSGTEASQSIEVFKYNVDTRTHSAYLRHAFPILSDSTCHTALCWTLKIDNIWIKR